MLYDLSVRVLFLVPDGGKKEFGGLKCLVLHPSLACACSSTLNKTPNITKLPFCQLCHRAVYLSRPPRPCALPWGSRENLSPGLHGHSELQLNRWVDGRWQPVFWYRPHPRQWFSGCQDPASDFSQVVVVVVFNTYYLFRCAGSSLWHAGSFSCNV